MTYHLSTCKWFIVKKTLTYFEEHMENDEDHMVLYELNELVQEYMQYLFELLLSNVEDAALEVKVANNLKKFYIANSVNYEMRSNNKKIITRSLKWNVIQSIKNNLCIRMQNSRFNLHFIRYIKTKIKVDLHDLLYLKIYQLYAKSIRITFCYKSRNTHFQFFL